jgi:hypothetical protein
MKAQCVRRAVFFSLLSTTAHSLFFLLLSIGFFLTDGEVRFKCSTAVGPEGLSDEVFDRMMPAAIGTMDRYFANMVKVGYGIMDPKEAVEEVEQSGSSPSSSMPQALMDALATAVSVDDSGTTTTTTNGVDDE